MPTEQKVSYQEEPAVHVKDYLHDRLLADTEHAPISQCSCEGTDWRSSLGRSAPCPRNAHLGNKENPPFTLFINKSKAKFSACGKKILAFLPLFDKIQERSVKKY